MDESHGQSEKEEAVSPEKEARAAPKWTNYQITKEEVLAELEALNRNAFRRVLADYLGYAPTPEAVQKLAEKAPDRWIQGLTMLAGLSGFKRDVTETNNILVIGSMSDSDLHKRLAQAEQVILENTRLINMDGVLPVVQDVSRDDKIVDVKAKELK